MLKIYQSILDKLRKTSLSQHSKIVRALVVAILITTIDLVLRISEYVSLFELLPMIGYLKFYGTLAGVFAQTIAILYLVVLLPRMIRLLAIMFLLLIFVVEMSYFTTLTRYMTSTDLMIALSSSKDLVQGAVSSFFSPAIILYAVPYVVCLSVLFFSHSNFNLRKQFGQLFIVVAFMLASNYALFAHGPEQHFHLNPPQSFVRTVFHYYFQNFTEYWGPRDELPDLHVSESPTDNIIYIIDESIRGSNLSLNGYTRATTPFLDTLEAHGHLRNLGICVAASTFSHFTNAYLISGHNRFPDKDYRTAINPTIFDYAKKMGYKTLYIDLDGSYLTKRTQRAGKDSIRSVDRWLTVNFFEASVQENLAKRDFAAAQLIVNLLNKKEGGHFIVLNKVGLHFHYRRRYPNHPDYEIWTPVMEIGEAINPSLHGREKLVNTYDNGIRFTVDRFFQFINTNIENQNYVILYTSDHGQTLSEQGQIYTHSQPDKVIADVPEFFITGSRYQKRDLIANIPQGVRISHLNNFATLLELMGVPESYQNYDYEQSIFDLTAEDNKTRYFMTGNLYGLAGNYEVLEIHTPPEPEWGTSHPIVTKATDSRTDSYHVSN